MSVSHPSFLVLALLAPAPLGAQALDWPHYAGPLRDATLGASGLIRSFGPEGPEIAWTEPVGPGFGSAAIVDGKVFLMDRIATQQDVLRVLDLETGAEEWRHAYDAPGRLDYAGSRMVPTVTDERIYTIGAFGQLISFDRASHEIVWRKHLAEDCGGELPQWGWSQSPLIVGDLVVAAALGDDVGLVALDKETGAEAWVTEGIGTSHSTPALFELAGRRQILMITTRGRKCWLTSFDPADGSTLWENDAFECRYPIVPPIQVGARRILLTGGYGAGSVMLEVTSGGAATKVETVFETLRGSQIHLPLVQRGHIYLLANENANSSQRKRENGGLTCLDMQGNELWRTGAEPYLGRGSMVLADGMLLVQDGLSGMLRLIQPDPEGFRLLAEAEIFGPPDGEDHQMWAPLALSRGRLLMRSQGEMKCVLLGDAR